MFKCYAQKCIPVNIASACVSLFSKLLELFLIKSCYFVNALPLFGTALLQIGSFCKGGVVCLSVVVLARSALLPRRHIVAKEMDIYNVSA